MSDPVADVARGDRRYAASPDAVFAAPPGGGVVLHMRTKRYYSLNESGALIWQLVHSGCAVRAVVEQLVVCYAVDAGTAERAVDRLLDDLVRNGLLVALDDPAPPVNL